MFLRIYMILSEVLLKRYWQMGWELIYIIQIQLFEEQKCKQIKKILKQQAPISTKHLMKGTILSFFSPRIQFPEKCGCSSPFLLHVSKPTLIVAHPVFKCQLDCIVMHYFFQKNMCYFISSGLLVAVGMWFCILLTGKRLSILYFKAKITGNTTLKCENYSDRYAFIFERVRRWESCHSLLYTLIDIQRFHLC